MSHLNDKHHTLIRDVKIISSEIQFLRSQIFQLLPESKQFTADRLINGSFEVQEVLARIEKLINQ